MGLQYITDIMGIDDINVEVDVPEEPGDGKQDEPVEQLVSVYLVFFSAVFLYFGCFLLRSSNQLF